MMSSPSQSSRDDPFRSQDADAASLRIDLEQSEVFDHEMLFEDDVVQLKDRKLFVGLGIPLKRTRAALCVVLLVFIGLLGRAGWMQLIEGDVYQARADENRYRSVVLPARRGIIQDRNGTVLAENVPSFHVRIRWSDLPREEDERIRMIATVARITGRTSEDVISVLHATGTRIDEWVDVAKDVSYERAISLSVELPELQGVTLVTAAKRKYPKSERTPSLSHVIGYVGSVSPEEYEQRKQRGYRRTDEIGKTGIERSYEHQIRGEPGERRVEVDAFGRPRAVVGECEPVDGNDVILTVDLALQEAVEEALRRGLERAEVTRGSAILMDPNDGSILAIVSLPTYDNNMFAGNVSSTAYAALIKDDNQPLFPRAWAGQYPSGSVIKPLIATAALEERIIEPDTTIISVGGIRVGPWFFPDWRAGGHGATNVRRAIAWSVNTFFYYIGGGYESFYGLGIVRLTQWMQQFGLGETLDLDVPNEAAGHVPTREWKEQTKGERWYIGDTYNLSIGQGDLLVTPVQIARVTASIANGGKLVRPHLVKGSEDTDPEQLPVRVGVWETVRLGMRDTVTYGSGRRLNALPVAVAGKTGTAQWRTDRPNHAWFAGFAPFDDPKVVVSILIEEGEEGAEHAVPVAEEVLSAWYERNGSE